MRYLLQFALLLWTAATLTAHMPDSTDTRFPDIPETDSLVVLPNGIKIVLDPLDRLPERGFSFSRFSTFPGEVEPYNNIRYNLADGLFLGLGSDTRRALWFDSSILAHGGFGYSFGSHYWQVFGGVDKRFGQRATATLFGAEGHILTDSYDSWRSASWENSLFSLLFERDNRNWFRRSGWSMHLEQHTDAGWTASVKYAYDKYEFLPKDSWTLFRYRGVNSEKEYRYTPVFEPSQTRSVIIAAAYSSMPPLPRFRGGVSAHVQTEIGTHIDAYNRSLAEFVWHQPLWPALTLYTHLRFGSATGDVIVPRLFTLGGYGSLPGFAWSEYTGNRMALLNTELVIHPAPFSLSRFWSSIGFILLANAGYTSMQKDDAPLLTGMLPAAIQNLHSDIGLAVGTRHGRGLCGVVWRTDTGQASMIIRFSRLL
jgi:hypothetical protein